MQPLFVALLPQLPQLPQLLQLPHPQLLHPPQLPQEQFL